MNVSMFMNLRLSQEEEQQIEQMPLELILQIRKSRYFERFASIFEKMYWRYVAAGAVFDNHISCTITDNNGLSLLTNSSFVKGFNEYLAENKREETKAKNFLLKNIFGDKYTPEVIVKKITIKEYKRSNKVVDIYYDTLY